MTLTSNARRACVAAAMAAAVMTAAVLAAPPAAANPAVRPTRPARGKGTLRAGTGIRPPGGEGPAGPPALLPDGRAAAPPSPAAAVAGAPGCLPAPYGANFYAPALGGQASASGGAKTVALTFDDGPGPTTSGLISVLRRYGVTATFMNIGENAAARPGLVREEAAGGYLVGNHTWNHPDMTTISASRQAAELDEASAGQERLIGWAPCVFRPPYGSYDGTLLRLAKARRMVTWLWSVDTEDWKAGGSSSSYWVNRIIHLAESEGGVQTHPVILMHNAASGDPATVLALPAIIRYFRARGYTFVNLAGATGTGYRVLTSGGGVRALGAAGYGRPATGHSGARAVSIATDQDTGGYWVLHANGGIAGVHAPGYGSLLGKLGKKRHAVAIAADRGGYLVLRSNGGISQFGSAHWYGSAAGRLGGRHQPKAVGLAVDQATGGYWILTSAGGVLNFHAPWYGSLHGKLRKGETAAAIAASPRGGYLLLTSAGRVRACHATWYGQARVLGHHVTAVGLTVAPATGGYLILLSSGGVLNRHTPWRGSDRGKIPARQAVTAIAAA